MVFDDCSNGIYKNKRKKKQGQTKKKGKTKEDDDEPAAEKVFSIAECKQLPGSTFSISRLFHSFLLIPPVWRLFNHPTSI